MWAYHTLLILAICILQFETPVIEELQHNNDSLLFHFGDLRCIHAQRENVLHFLQSDVLNAFSRKDDRKHIRCSRDIRMCLVLRCVEDLELWIVCTGDLVHVELLGDMYEHVLIHFDFARLFVDVKYATDQGAGIDHIIDALRFPNAEAQIVGHGDQDLPRFFLVIDGRGIDRTEDLIRLLLLNAIPGSGRGHRADATVGTGRDTEFGTIGRTTRTTTGVTPPGTEIGTVGTALFTLDRTDTNAQANARVTEIGTTTTLFGTVVDTVIGTAVFTLLRTVDVTGSLTTGTTQGTTGTTLESTCLHTGGALLGALLHTHGSTTRSDATDTAIVVTGPVRFGPTDVAATTTNTIGGTSIGATTTTLSSCLRRAVLITIRLA